MVGEESGSAATFRTCDEQVLRGHIESAAGLKTNLTDEQLVVLLLSTFPQSYSRRNRKHLIERVAKIRREYDGDEHAPATKKRRIVDENGDASGQNEALSSATSAIASGSKKSKGRKHVDDRRGVNENGNDVRKDVNVDSLPIVRDLAIIDGLGDGRREMEKNGGGGRRDRRGNNWPMLSDLHGMDRDCKLIDMLNREVILPLNQLKLFRHFGVEPTSRILLHGPPGCGKTTLARAIANEAGLPLSEISAASLVSGASGAPKESIRELFSRAFMRAPSVVFIDEIEPHITNQLLACMDEAYRLVKPVNHNADPGSSNTRPAHVLVIGATNEIDALDPAFRQWFDREIVIRAPDEDARRDILLALTSNLKIEVGFDHAKVARWTLGFVAGDLVALAKQAGIRALNRTMDERVSSLNKEQMVEVQFKDDLKNCYRKEFSDEELHNLSITTGDFKAAGEMVRPSSKMEGFSTTPNAKWDDVVGLQFLKFVFERQILYRIKFPEVYKDLSYGIYTKFFLYGPTGSGKTLIVEALANEAGANFIHVKAPELLKYGDQSELVVRNLFSYARTRSPSVLFFDELDVITLSSEDERRWPDFRQLVKQLGDVKGDLGGVFVIGATNRAQAGVHFSLIKDQFDKILYVPLPSPEERGEILKNLARNRPIDADVDLLALAKSAACENFNGDDLFALMTEAGVAAMDRPTLLVGGCREPWTIKDADFKTAFKKISATVPSMLLDYFKLFTSQCLLPCEKDMNVGRLHVGMSMGEFYPDRNR